MKLLTKSDYLAGLQCPKLLWIIKNDKERLPELTEIEQKRFDEGHLIGELAKKIFPEGIDLSEEDFNPNIEKTKNLVRERKTLFEPSFLSDGLFSRADILLPVGNNEWDIIEVKSSTKVKDLHVHDVAFQKHVYEKAGLKIRKCFLMHINSEYVKEGDINPREFFVKTEVTESAETLSKGMKEKIDKMFETIKSEDCPEFSVEDLLTIEYDNIVKEEFFSSLPEENIFEFYRIPKKKAVELYKKGIVKMSEVPEVLRLNEKQSIQKKLALEGGINVNKNKINAFLDKLEYPIYYLDFETINPALPKFDGMKPYQRIPFQFSLHIQRNPNDSDDKLKHISFLAEGANDPRQEFMQALKDSIPANSEGSILVYNQSFEKGVLNECADAFPEFRDWCEDILPRIKDLWDVFKDFSYYHPKQKGSASLKAVLPVLSDLKYDNLEINKGDIASYEWERINFLENVSYSEKRKVQENLEKYCKLDTFAEVEILKELKELVS